MHPKGESVPHPLPEGENILGVALGGILHSEYDDD